MREAQYLRVMDEKSKGIMHSRARDSLSLHYHGLRLTRARLYVGKELFRADEQLLTSFNIFLFRPLHASSFSSRLLCIAFGTGSSYYT